MKKFKLLTVLITAFCFLTTCNIHSQTKVWKTDKDGKIRDKNNYYLIEKSGKIYEVDGEQKQREPAGVIFKIEGTIIFLIDEKTEQKRKIGEFKNNIIYNDIGQALNKIVGNKLVSINSDKVYCIFEGSPIYAAVIRLIRK